MVSLCKATQCGSLQSFLGAKTVLPGSKEATQGTSLELFLNFSQTFPRLSQEFWPGSSEVLADFPLKICFSGRMAQRAPVAPDRKIEMSQACTNYILVIFVSTLPDLGVVIFSCENSPSPFSNEKIIGISDIW